MQYLYGKSHIKNIKKNHQEKYNLIFNQIIFSSKVTKKSRVLVMGLADRVLVEDLINRGYVNIFFSDKYDKVHHLCEMRNNRIFDMIDYDLEKNDDECSKYDLLIISVGYDVKKLESELANMLKLLKEGGKLIFMFNAYIKAYSPVWKDIRDLYENTMPSLFDGDAMSLDEQLGKLNSMIKSSKDISPLKSQNYNWIEEYTINEYCSLIEGTDCYKGMDVTKQINFSSRLHKMIDINGGSLKKANRMTVISCNKL